MPKAITAVLILLAAALPLFAHEYTLIVVAEKGITLLIWLVIVGLPVAIPLAIIWLLVRRRVPKSFFTPRQPAPPAASKDRPSG